MERELTHHRRSLGWFFLAVLQAVQAFFEAVDAIAVALQALLYILFEVIAAFFPLARTLTTARTLAPALTFAIHSSLAAFPSFFGVSAPSARSFSSSTTHCPLLSFARCVSVTQGVLPDSEADYSVTRIDRTATSKHVWLWAARSAKGSIFSQAALDVPGVVETFHVGLPEVLLDALYGALAGLVLLQHPDLVHQRRLLHLGDVGDYEDLTE